MKVRKRFRDLYLRTKAKRLFPDCEGCAVEFVEVISLFSDGELSYLEIVNTGNHMFGRFNGELVDEFDVIVLGDKAALMIGWENEKKA